MLDVLRQKLNTLFPNATHRLGILMQDSQQHTRLKWAGIGVLILLLIPTLWWNQVPDPFDPATEAKAYAEQHQHQWVSGYTSTYTLAQLIQALLNKPGGYLSNDKMPPTVWFDNVPNWEFGVLTQIRDYARALRNDMSRSQSQSTEDKDLAAAEPQLSFNAHSWLFPSSENEYQQGLSALDRYLQRLGSGDAQFYTRADNLTSWLAVVEKRLGSLSQRLSASVGQHRINTDLAPAPTNTPSATEIVITQTPWTEIDDVFYQCRGSAWALIHLLKAAEHDFADVLVDKNALLSLRQIIRELESTQHTMWSPVILNGSGFGYVANHSLVMASYISRANAAIIDLRNLLDQG